jgi:PAS domain S-box-containing protein
LHDVGRISRRDTAGHPVTVTGAVMDIADRRRVEEALSANELRFRQMFHGHSAVKLVIDPTTGRIVDANEAAARFYGWPISELKEMTIQQINDLPSEVVRDRMASAAAAPSARFEFRHRLADNSTREVEVYSNKIQIAGRAYLYSIIHDITERVLAEQTQHCKKIRDDRGYWEQVEAYVSEHTEAQFSHSICPQCLELFYPEE